MAAHNLISIAGIAPRVHPTAWIAPTATVVGDVDIAEGASVFYGAVVRGDQASISIGAGSNLQDLVVVHADPGYPAKIGSGVSVGHGAILHGCIVEDGCLVGMGSIILNGVAVGAGSLVAAGALVLADAVIPARSLISGAPAKVRRSLSDKDLAMLKENAENYLRLAARHRGSLTVETL